jgi:hypothetical protein
MAIAAVVCGPMINRAMQRDADDQRLYDSATEMLADWIGKREPRTSERITGNMGGTTTVKEPAPNRMQPAFTTRS